MLDSTPTPSPSLPPHSRAPYRHDDPRPGTSHPASHPPPSRLRERRGLFGPLPLEIGPPLAGRIAPEFIDRIDRVLAECRRAEGTAAVLALSVQGVLTPDGEPAPDLEECLALEFGHRLRARVRNSDHVLSIGERDFGVVLLDAGLAAASVVRSRLQRELRGVYQLQARLAWATFSIGQAVFPRDGASGTQLAAVALATHE